MKRPRLDVVGMSNVDHVWHVERFPPLASRTATTGYRLQGGGPAATAAVAIARLGADVTLWSLHGDDEGGRHARRELEENGVDCAGVRTISGATTPVSAVLVAPDGERSIFPYRDPRLFEIDGRGVSYGLEGVACVLSDNRYPRLSEGVLRAARERSIPTVGDWSDARHWELTELVDHLVVSEECATEILGSIEPGDPASLEGLRTVAGQTVGVTLGERGLLIDDGREPVHLPAHRVEVVDTTGAGDVFHGSYAYGVALGWQAARAARFASAAAALSCRGSGRSEIPARDEVEAMLARG